MEHTALSPAEMPADSIYWADSHRSDMLEWVDMKENSHDDMLVVGLKTVGIGQDNPVTVFIFTF